MKKLDNACKMRWIAGGLYALLALYQLFLSKDILGQVSLTSTPLAFMYDFALILVALGMCMWMFSGRAALGDGVRRVVVVGTAFCVVFELMSYSLQTEFISVCLSMTFPQWWQSLSAGPGATVLMYIAMVLRLLLLIVAAFLVVNAAQKPAAELEETDEKLPENVEIAEKAEEDEEKDEETSESSEILEEETSEKIDEKIEEKAEENAAENTGKIEETV